MNDTITRHRLPWTVAEFAARTGVPASTLRFWDDQGLLPADRLDNGHRRYGEEHLHRAEMIQMCQVLGCTIDEMRLILNGGDQRLRAEYAEQKLPEVIQKIATLRAAEQVLRHLAQCAHQDAASCGAWLRELLDGADLAADVTPTGAAR